LKIIEYYKKGQKNVLKWSYN